MGPHSRQGGGHHGTPGSPQVLNVHDNGRRPCVSLLRPTYIPSCASVGDLFGDSVPVLAAVLVPFGFHVLRCHFHLFVFLSSSCPTFPHHHAFFVFFFFRVFFLFFVLFSCFSRHTALKGSAQRQDEPNK